MGITRYLAWLELLLELIRIVIEWSKSNGTNEKVAHLFMGYPDHPPELHDIREVIAELDKEPDTKPLAEMMAHAVQEAELRA